MKENKIKKITATTTKQKNIPPQHAALLSMNIQNEDISR